MHAPSRMPLWLSLLLWMGLGMGHVGLTTVAAELTLYPSSIELSSAGERHGVLVSGPALADLTRQSRFVSSDPSVFEVSSNGLCRPVGDGHAELIAIHKGSTRRIPVRVTGATQHPVPSFQQDIEPILTRLGCNMGACHGKQAGQNGFKLSLRGYAPELDHAWLTTDVLGRRIDPAFPEDSLLVQKPLGVVPHEGKVKFEHGSRYHRMLVEWIRARAPGPIAGELSADRLEILPGDRVLTPGSTQHLLVRAYWPDGRVKDVTWLAQFFSNNEPIASVTADGQVQMRRSGETSIRAHFQGLVAVVRVTAPFRQSVAASAFKPEQTAVDRPVLDKLRGLRLPLSRPADDLTFLRRAMLDTIGTLPSPQEVEHFASDTRADKRQRLVESLFTRSEFTDYWTLQIADLLQNRKERDHDVRGNKNVRAFHTWLRGEVAAHRPWDQLVRRILTARGDSIGTPEIGYFIYLVGEKQPTESDVTDAVAQTFLGARIGCARCHNHPLERYTQDDFYHFAAFFDRISLDRKPNTELTIESRDEKEKSKRLTEAQKRLQEAQAQLLKSEGAGTNDAVMRFAERQRETAEAKREWLRARTRPPQAHQPRTHQQLEARALDRAPVDWQGVTDPRAALADWITSRENPAFSGVMINRLWKHFFGVGLVEPVDDLRASNPPSNPGLWAILSREFETSGYDLRHVMRLILNSRVYQLSSETVPGNETDTRFYSHCYARRLPSEVIADALSAATGVPDSFEGFPVGLRAIQLPEATVGSYFLTLFGRSERVTACACERSGDVTLPQLLHLQNGEEITRKVNDPGGRLRSIQSAAPDPKNIVTQLFLATFSRPPNAEELRRCLAVVNTPDPKAALADLFWALLNSKEFSFNH